MKYPTISLFLLLFTGSSLLAQHYPCAKEVNNCISRGKTPTGYQLVRFVCQAAAFTTKQLRNHVVILEQISSKTMNTDSADFPTIDGSVLMDPNGRIMTDKGEFRMRIYNNTSLVSSTQTVEQIVEDLLDQEASFNKANQLMDYRGVGYRFVQTFVFTSTNVHLQKKMSVFIEDHSGELKTIDGNQTLEDGYYICQEPVLVPEMTEQTPSN